MSFQVVRVGMSLGLRLTLSARGIWLCWRHGSLHKFGKPCLEWSTASAEGSHQCMKDRAYGPPLVATTGGDMDGVLIDPKYAVRHGVIWLKARLNKPPISRCFEFKGADRDVRLKRLLLYTSVCRTARREP